MLFYHIIWIISYKRYHMVHMKWTIWYGPYDMDHIIWTMIFSWISLKHYNLANVKYYDVNKKLNQRLRDARKLSDDWESKSLHAISFQLQGKLLILKTYFSIHCTNWANVRHYAGRRISALSYESSFEVRYFHHFIRGLIYVLVTSAELLVS